MDEDDLFGEPPDILCDTDSFDPDWEARQVLNSQRVRFPGGGEFDDYDDDDEDDEDDEDW